MGHAFIDQPVLILLRALHKFLAKLLGELLFDLMQLHDICSVGGPN